MKRDSRLFWIALPVLTCALITGIGLVSPASRSTPTPYPTASTSLQLQVQRHLERLPEVRAVDAILLDHQRLGSTLVLEVRVNPGAVTTTTADRILTAASTYITAWSFFSAILTDGAQTADFIYNFITDQWTITPLKP